MQVKSKFSLLLLLQSFLLKIRGTNEEAVEVMEVVHGEDVVVEVVEVVEVLTTLVQGKGEEAAGILFASVSVEDRISLEHFSIRNLRSIAYRREIANATRIFLLIPV